MSANNDDKIHILGLFFVWACRRWMHHGTCPMRSAILLKNTRFSFSHLDHRLHSYFFDKLFMPFLRLQHITLVISRLCNCGMHMESQTNVDFSGMWSLPSLLRSFFLQEGHIPGAVFFDVDKISDVTSDVSSLVHTCTLFCGREVAQWQYEFVYWAIL